MARTHILAIDQGTTSSRVILYDAAGTPVGSVSQELTQHYPQPGWVEHDADEIWEGVTQIIPRLLETTGVRGDQVAAIGLTNQRETTVLWDRSTGKPIARAVVWQDRRTAEFCRTHRQQESWLYERTGLVLDPYFSATKIRWLLDQVPGARQAAEAGQLAFGTIDSFLVWRLTGGELHATDMTNASRTLLLNLHSARWDQELCDFMKIPTRILPDVRPSSGDFGVTRGLRCLPDGIPIAGVAGDQQAALFGQRCFTAGEAKCTYGTGAFFLIHTGSQPKLSRHRLVATMAATTDTTPQYALEGSVFIAGAAVQWLRDGLKLFRSAPEVEELARAASPDEAVYFVPALVGLGAPHWVPEARGVILGITRGTTSADIARATMDGVAFQVVDLIETANQDTSTPLAELRVDGGMARNDFFMQIQADLLGRPLVRSHQSEATAEGAAFLAGLKVGFWKDLNAIRQLPRTAERFKPQLEESARQARLEGWRRAVKTVIGHYHH